MQHALAPAPHIMPNNSQDSDEAALRSHLLQQVHSPPSSAPQSMDNMRPSSSASPHDHNIDPAIGGNQRGVGSADSGDDMGDDPLKKGGKRELSTSKRAAQNRAAQRAFRQRKEGYIKKLEEQVKDLHDLEESYKQIQAENYQLRDYIINLQSRLIESRSDVPPPPSSITFDKPQLDLRQITSGPISNSQQQSQARLQTPIAHMSGQTAIGSSPSGDSAGAGRAGAAGVEAGGAVFPTAS